MKQPCQMPAATGFWVIPANSRWTFTDAQEDFTVHVRRGVAAVQPRRPADPDLSITVTAEVWKAIAFGKTSPAAAFARGDLDVDGGVIAVVSFLRLFDR